MKDSRIQYAVVGAFVLVALAGLVVALALLSGRTGSTDSYHVVYRNVRGVVPGTEVLFEGFRIGQVADVEPFRTAGEQRYRVDIRVDEGWPIPSDSTAQITAPGLLAAFAIEIRSGESQTFLDPGSEIPGMEAADVFAAVSSLAGEIQEFTRTGLSPLVESFSHRAPQILRNLEAFAKDLATAGDSLEQLFRVENMQEVELILQNFRATAESIARVSSDLTDTQTGVQELISNLNTVIAKGGPNLDESLVDLRYTLDSVARHIDSINYNLEGASRNMNEFSRQLRQNPGLLLRGRSNGEAPGE